MVTSEHAQSVLYCVASNFLEVKQLASVLMRQLPPSAVGLQVNLHIWKAADISPPPPQHLMLLNDVNNGNRFCTYSSNYFLPVGHHHELLCGIRTRRGCAVSFRQLWTSAPVPNHSTVLQQPISSICCCPSLTSAKLCCTLHSRRTFSLHQHHSHHSLLSLPSLRSTPWLVGSGAHS